MSDVASAKAPAGPRGLPFQIRGSLQTLLSLRLLRPDEPEFFPLLLDKIAHSPDFFRHAPFVLDVAPLAEQPPIDLEAFVAKLREQRLIAVGLQNGNEAWIEEAGKAGLAIMPPGSTAPAMPARPTPQQAPVSTPSAPPAPAGRRGSGLVITEPVRSGQQVFYGEGDITVLSTVSSGAEIAATGHIHVYGPLRGRAFAGVEGDERAMIFCDQLNAELLSIAGVYLVNEELDRDAVGRRVRVSCAGERLFVTSVS
jgi:septum site-determining protein MinC